MGNVFSSEFDVNEVTNNILYALGQAGLSDVYEYGDKGDAVTVFWFDNSGRLVFDGVLTPYCFDDIMEISYGPEEKTGETVVRIAFADYRSLILKKNDMEMETLSHVFHYKRAILQRLYYRYRTEILRLRVNPLIIINQRVIAYCGADYCVDIPEGVRRIGKYAFEHSRLSAVRFPSTVFEIEDYAFSNCENLIEVLFKEEEYFLGAEAAWDEDEEEVEILPAPIRVNVDKAFFGANRLNFK